MEVVELPLKKHYVIFTHKGFSTFFFNESNEKSFSVQDIPIRFCFNLMKADLSDIKMIDAENAFYQRFKFFAIKYFGMPILADMRLKDVINQYEKPLEELLLMHAQQKTGAEIIEAITAIDSSNKNKELEVHSSPLYIFTKNGIPDFN